MKQKSNIELIFKETGTIYCPHARIYSPEDVSFIFKEIENSDREKFVVLSLDGENKVLATEVVSIGSLDAAVVHPREVYKTPLKLNAKKIICLHNHPSGSHDFSDEDVTITKRLEKAGEILGIELLYHIVVGAGSKRCIYYEGGKARRRGETAGIPSGEFPLPDDYLASPGRNDGSMMTAVPKIEIDIRRTQGSKKSGIKEIIVRTPEDALEVTADIFKNTKKDLTVVMYLNTRNEVISLNVVRDIDTAELLKTAVLQNAASFIISSTSGEVLNEDKIKEIEKESKVVGIELLDALKIYRQEAADKSSVNFISYQRSPQEFTQATESGIFLSREPATSYTYENQLTLDFDQPQAEAVQQHGEEEKKPKISKKPDDKEIEELVLSSRQNFSDEEKEILIGYEGKGGKKKAEGRGLLDEYYTPDIVKEKFWEVVGVYIDTRGKPLQILEPSIGKGALLYGRVLHRDSIVVGYEINPVAARIAHAVLRDDDGWTVKVFNEHFESIFIDERGNSKNPDLNTYDLVIGNPPYGEHRGRYLGLGEEPQIGEYSQYFLKRSLELTKENGLVAFVMPSGFLRSKENYAKEEISKLGFLVDAYRLPNGAFPTTDVGTDIVVFRKNLTRNQEIINKRLAVLAGDSFFNQNHDKIWGIEDERKGRFGPEKYVYGSEDNIINNSPLKVDESYLAQFYDISPIQPTPTPPGRGKRRGSKKEEEPGPAEESPRQGQVPTSTTEERKIFRPLKENNCTQKELEIWRHTSPTGEIDTEWLKEINLDDYKGLLNYCDGRYYNDFNYCNGNIHQKLDHLELDREQLDEDTYLRQRNLLQGALPSQVTDLNDLRLSPIDPLVKEVVFVKGGESVKLMQKFSHYLELLDNEVFGDSSRYEVREYIRGQPVYGRNAGYNMIVRRRRRAVAEKIFNTFLKEELTDEEKAVLIKTYNRARNAAGRVDYRHVPLLTRIPVKFKGSDFKPHPHQVTGVGFLVNKGLGCLAHEVGAGKTLTSIIATKELLLERGWIKKPLFVVPKSVYHKWINEIKEIMPDVKINELYNLGKKYTDGGLKEIEPGSITVMTIEGLTRLGFKPETYARLSQNLKDVIAGINTTGKKSKRAEALESEKAEVMAGKAMRKTSGEIFFEDLGFDHIVLDEAHRYKNIFTSAKIARGQANEFANIRGGNSSARGIKAYFATQYILEQNKGRGVYLLTATPFTNSPMEYYSMLSLVAKKKMEESGLDNVNTFMSAFMDMKTTFVVKADRTLKEEDVIERFRNARQLRLLVNEYFDFKTGEELGITRPDKIRKTVNLKPTRMQINYMRQAEDLFEDTDAGGVIVGITELQNITLSPFLSRFSPRGPAGYKEFVEKSPKIYFVMEAIKQVKKDRPEAGQIIYMSRGIEYHPFVKEYLVKEVGYKEEEVEIISSIYNSSDTAADDVKDRFNAGEIKVLIGSDSIKEGVDLQERATDIYTLHLPWNPLDIDQVEGRLWRYGNRWANIRSTFPLIENSIDPFIFQKLETKLKRIQNVRTDNTNEIDVGELDFSELKLDLITDPLKRLKAAIKLEENQKNEEITTLKAEIAYLKSLTEREERLKEQIERSKKNIEFYKSYNNQQHMIKNIERRLKDARRDLEEFYSKLQDKSIDLNKLEEKRVSLIKTLMEKEKELENMKVESEKKIKALLKEQGEINIETPLEGQDEIYLSLPRSAIEEIHRENLTLLVEQNQKGGGKMMEEKEKHPAPPPQEEEKKETVEGAFSFVADVKSDYTTKLAAEESGTLCPNCKANLAKELGYQQYGIMSFKLSLNKPEQAEPAVEEDEFEGLEIDNFYCRSCGTKILIDQDTALKILKGEVMKLSFKDEVAEQAGIEEYLTANNNVKEGSVMIKVASGVEKGSYVALIKGPDEKFGFEREFLPLKTKYLKGEKGKMDIFLLEENVPPVGSIVAMKLIGHQMKGEERFYEVVQSVEESAREQYNDNKGRVEFYNIVGRRTVQEVKEKFGIKEKEKSANPHHHEKGTDLGQERFSSSMRSKDTTGKEKGAGAAADTMRMDGQGIHAGSSKEQPGQEGRKVRAAAGRDELLVNSQAGAKSYVARIAGIDPKFGFEREILAWARKDGTLAVKKEHLKPGDAISLKIVKPGQDAKEAQEHFYLISKDTRGAVELKDVVEKADREKIKQALEEAETADLTQEEGGEEQKEEEETKEKSAENIL